MKPIYMLCILLFSNFMAQAQWNWFTPYPDGIRLNGVWMVDESHAWAVGDQGKIITWDGSHWQKQASNTQANLHSVSFSDINHGYAVGANGCILKYLNGTWTDQSLPTPANLVSVRLFEDDGWILGDTVLRFRDNNWNAYPLQDSLRWYSMSFPAADDGWIISTKGNGSRSLYNFDGVSWKPEMDLNSQLATQLSFADQYHGIIAEREMDNDALQNYDHGNLTIGMGTAFLRSVFMIDSVTGYATGSGGWFMVGDDRGYIYKFADGNWKTDTIVGGPLNCIHGNQNMVWAVGESGNIYLKKNGSWKLTNSYLDQTIVHESFPDSLHGWMTAWQNEIFRYKSDKVERDTVFPGYRFKAIHFVDSSKGYALADTYGKPYFYFLRYQAGKWITDTVSSVDFPVSLAVLDSIHIWVCCDNSILFYNGTSWQVEYTVPAALQYFDLYDISPVSPGLVYAVGNSFITNSSTIFKYDGTGWNILNDSLPGFMARISPAGQYCWITGNYGNIWRYDTQTGELLEELPSQGYYFDYPGLQMLGPDKGFASNYSGLVEYDGSSWQYVNGLPLIPYFSFDFSNPDYHWASGYYGILLSDYAYSTLKSPDSPIAQSCLARIYPNPVAGPTVVEFEVKKPSEVLIELFDPDGRKIKTLIDSFHATGSYRVPLGTLFPTPGIYFCRIVIGKESTTVKLVSG